MRTHIAFPRTARQRATDGFIIVAVLWILGALATLCSIFAVYVATTVTGLGVNDDRLQSEALVSAAMELTAYKLTAGGSESRRTPGNFKFRLGRAEVGVEFCSEAARIDLNVAPKDLLAGLFAVLGARAADVDEYANRIIAWRSSPSAQDPEITAYQAVGLPYKPRKGPFPSVGELWLVRGLPPTLVERALPYVTVFNGRPSINVLEAAPEVIAALPGMTPERSQAIVSQRAAGTGNLQTIAGLLGPAQNAATLDGTKAVRVTGHVKFDNGRQVDSQVVILLLEEGEEPFRVLSWRDDFDGPSVARFGLQ